ncbi:Uncharacterised protein [Enterobacter cloacae]|uniref:Tail fiber protein n=1 Tax=Enterobacter cloacae TaxID=550 RepID=A0A157CSX4_ENTCL|nr:hypothetical protein [Enterobacter cloacae]CZV65286.1 Uncharacterised protein [Enterobacter cloacae]SAG89684.1 Uncharacterised protein [Enterobacter cloacae]
MHRIDTPTAQTDKFGQGKNGFTNGDPATGRRATDLNSDMWDAVQEEICTAIEKSGAALNKGQHDQLYQAIVKLITDRVPDALLRSKNLSDVVDKALARTNLELGTAAIRNTADNSNNNALVPVGYKGNFTADSNHGAIDFSTYPFVVGESLFVDARGCTNNPPFLTQDFYYIDVVCATGPAVGGRVNRPLIQFVSYTNSKLILAIREDDGTTIGWRYFRAVQYDSDNTTVTIPGALKAVNGAIQLSQNAIIIRGAGNKHLWFHNQSGSEMGLVYASDDKVLHLRAGEGISVDIASDGSLVANYLGAKGDIHSNRNISCDGFVQSNAGVYDTPGVRVYSPNNPPPQQDLNPYVKRDGITFAGLAGNNIAYPYMRQAGTDTLVYLAPSDWVNGNFISSGRRGGQAFQAGSGSGQGMAYEAPAGCFLTGINTLVADGRGMGVYYRALQVYIPSRGYVQIGD